MPRKEKIEDILGVRYRDEAGRVWKIMRVRKDNIYIIPVDTMDQDESKKVLVGWFFGKQKLRKNAKVTP